MDASGGRPELWLAAVPEPSRVEGVAARAEAAGWDGIAFTDSQNLVADPFVAVAMAARATSTLRFMTGVTNAATRDPAALATVAATAQEYSGGRFVLGIGRGDTALFHLGRPPQPVDAFADAPGAGAGLPPGRGRRPRRVPQPAAVARAGRAARRADRPGRGRAPRHRARGPARRPGHAGGRRRPRPRRLGRRPARRRLARRRVAFRRRGAGRGRFARRGSPAAARSPGGRPDLGAYVVVGCHPDLAVARDLVRGALAAFLHFSAMPGSTGAGVAEADREAFAELGAAYDSRRHLRNAAAHSAALADDLIDRHAIVGPPERCVERLAALAALGVGRFVIAGPTLDADPAAARDSLRLLRQDVLPAARELTIGTGAAGTTSKGEAHAAPHR